MWYSGCLWTHLICFCLAASLESIFSINSFPSLPPNTLSRCLSHIQNSKSPGVPSNYKFRVQLDSKSLSLFCFMLLSSIHHFYLPLTHSLGKFNCFLISHSSPAQTQVYPLLKHFHVEGTENKTIIHHSNAFPFKYWVLNPIDTF